MELKCSHHIGMQTRHPELALRRPFSATIARAPYGNIAHITRYRTREHGVLHLRQAGRATQVQTIPDVPKNRTPNV